MFIALPAFGQINCAQTTFSLMALAKALIHSGRDYYFSDYSFPDIAESRNALTSIWYDKTNAEWMLHVDADMSFSPQLIIDMLEFGKPLTGVLAPKKRHPIEFVGSWKAGAKIQNGFMQMDGIGFGIALIHRSVIHDMLETNVAESDPRAQDFGLDRIIRAFDIIKVDGRRLPEDKSFCHRYKQCGGEVWANISHRIGHVGLTEFAGRFADHLAEEAA